MEASNAVLRDVLLGLGLTEGTITRMLLAREADGHLTVHDSAEVVRERPTLSLPVPYSKFDSLPSASVHMVRTYEYALPQIHSPNPLAGTFVVMFRSKPHSQLGTKE